MPWTSAPGFFRHNRVPRHFERISRHFESSEKSHKMTSYNQFYVYIISNKYHTVFYTGITNNLIKRVYEHKNKLVQGFTKRYNLNQLIYYECADNPESAIVREKQIKDYRRSKKLGLIKKVNPEMTDIYLSITLEKAEISRPFGPRDDANEARARDDANEARARDDAKDRSAQVT